MGFGFAILAAIMILVLSIVMFGYWGIPVAIVLTAVFVGFTMGLAKKKSGQPGGGSESARPEDKSGGGPLHEHEGYAHEGQANMTPEQSSRAGA